MCKNTKHIHRFKNLSTLVKIPYANYFSKSRLNIRICFVWACCTKYNPRKAKIYTVLTLGPVKTTIKNLFGQKSFIILILGNKSSKFDLGKKSITLLTLKVYVHIFTLVNDVKISYTKIATRDAHTEICERIIDSRWRRKADTAQFQ